MRPARGVLVAHLRALALDLPFSPFQLPAVHLGLLLLHAIGLLLVARLAHWPLWLAPALLAAMCLPSLLRRRWFAEILAPFVILYGVAVLRLAIVYGLRRAAPPALDYTWALGLSATWALLSTAHIRYGKAVLTTSTENGLLLFGESAALLLFQFSNRLVG